MNPPRKKKDEWYWRKRTRTQKQPQLLHIIHTFRDVLQHQDCMIYEQAGCIFIGFVDGDRTPLDRHQAAEVAQILVDFADRKEQKEAA